MQFLGINKYFLIALIIILIQPIKINYVYSQTSEQLLEESNAIYDEMGEFAKVVSKGTPKSEVLSYFGHPDKIEKNILFGYEVWQYRNVYRYNENMGSQGIVFRDDKIAEVSDMLSPPEWLWWKQIMQVLFFPAYILIAIPALFYFSIPFAFFCVVGIFMFQGWWRFFCIYLLLGFASMILPWVFLIAGK